MWNAWIRFPGLLLLTAGAGLVLVAGGARGQCPDPALDSDGDGLTDCDEAALDTDPHAIDTDGDGLPDNFEVTFAFDPRSPVEADGDADGDALTNLEEFLRNSDPRMADDPAPLFHVAPGGMDTKTGGDRQHPFATIAFALARFAESGAPATRIILEAGLYREDVTLAPGVTLTGRPGEIPMVEGVVTGAHDSALARLELMTATGGVVLLAIDNVAMQIHDLRFTDWSEGGGTIGIRTTGLNVSASVIDRCDFTGLMTGIEIVDAVPIVRRSLFEDQRLAGIHVLETAVLEPGIGLSSAADPARGYNTIRYNTDIPDPVETPLGIISDTPKRLLCENIDWGTNDLDAVRALFQGDCDWNPILVSGSAVLASSLFCRVWDSADQKALTSATMTLAGSGFDALTQSENGHYVFPSVNEGTYTLRCAVEGYAPQSMEVSMLPGETKAVTFAMDAEDTTPPPTPMQCRLLDEPDARAARSPIAVYMLALLAFH